jgi:Smg protein
MMKENVLDVLVYLFEHFIYAEDETARDRDSLRDELQQAGFSNGGIQQAFEWLEELERRRPHAPGPVGPTGPVRIYAEAEMDRLDGASRGFLMYLEQQGVLDPARRELVLDRIMALPVDELSVEDLKWVVLMVLFNQPGQEAAFAWMENHLLEDGDGEVVH